MQDTIYFHGSILMNNVDWCASLNCYMLRRIRDQHYIFIAWKVGRGGGGGVGRWAEGGGAGGTERKWLQAK